MKQRFFRIALLALSVATVACSKSEIDNIPPSTPPISEPTVSERVSVSVTATIAGSEQTRVTLTPTTEGSAPIVKINWKAEGETFAVINGEATTTFEQIEGSLFEGTLPEGTASYLGIYPASAASDDGKTFTIDLAQQTGTLDESKTYMLSAKTTNGLSYHFYHATALLQPTFKMGGELLANETISKVVVKNTTTTHSIDLFAGTSSTDTTGDITIERTPSEDDIYISLCKAYSAEEQIGVWVYTTAGDKETMYEGTITVPQGKSLELGKLYTPTVAVTKVEATPNTILYFADEKADIVTEGFGFVNTTHTFANGIGRISTIDDSAWTALPSYAFTKSEEPQKVILPSTIVEVKEAAFNMCTNLEEVIMPGVKILAEENESNQYQGVFSGCSKLKRVEAPAMESIGAYAFDSRTALEEVVLPTTGDGYTIGEYAFFGCLKLTSINLSKATTIDQHAFYECTSLTAVELTEATEIKNAAFNLCSNLTSAKMPKVTSIGSSAFVNCT